MIDCVVYRLTSQQTEPSNQQGLVTPSAEAEEAGRLHSEVTAHNVDDFML